MAVGLGAFGGHGLKARLSSEMLAVWQTAVRYHAWLAVGFSAPSLWTKAAGWLLLGGVVLFSGSLYALALGAPRAMGAITPLGGVLFILGWLALAIGVIYARTPA